MKAISTSSPVLHHSIHITILCYLYYLLHTSIYDFTITLLFNYTFELKPHKSIMHVRRICIRIQ